VELGAQVELAAYGGLELQGRLRRAFADVRVSQVQGGWEDEWRRFHLPVRVGRLWVGPPWETPDPDALPVVIDPGRAFGTGAHPTTRLCLELLTELAPTSVADLGCGSGVLAVAAAQLGFAPVVALDSDETAVEAARANAHANAVEVEVRRADVLADPLPTTELALANLDLRGVEALAPRVRSRQLVLSGLLASERPRLDERWRLLERREREGWAAELRTRRRSRTSPAEIERAARLEAAELGTRRQSPTISSKLAVRSSSRPSPPQPR
jgi:ribosomal protein L11 methyltransferase